MASRTADESNSRSGIVIPLRSFHLAKVRLRDVLDEDDRIALMQRCALQVIRAAGSHQIAVVTSDDAVIAFARSERATIIDDPGSLDAAATEGVRWARGLGCDRVVVLHADLPFADDLTALIAPGRARVAIVVPDQRDDGTPAISIPTDSTFRFAYGPGSFDRHCAAAVAAGLTLAVIHDPRLGFDVDLPSDLDAMTKRMRS
jgi:2-phospho-L-lactate guanylyltransferase